jgi:hypothetical protein
LPADAPPNRLGLAYWLVDPQQPLTARVAANRFWQHLFGVGIVATSEDFGFQGERPSHPELLDWLAVEFSTSGWDIKQLLRTMVTSATYRQSADVHVDHYRLDPDNRLLARGPRFRLDAEQVRDAALSVSDLLTERMGGKSVRTYQPAGLWEAVGYPASNTAHFVKDAGESLCRRSVYTFWKRTAPPSSLQIFDAPSREVCTARRQRTNTAAAALVLMNDEQFVEAARHLATRIQRDDTEDSRRLSKAFRRVTSRWPDADELRALSSLLADARREFAADSAAALAFTTVGESATDQTLDSSELAAWTMVATTLLNLDEALHK